MMVDFSARRACRFASLERHTERAAREPQSLRPKL